MNLICFLLAHNTVLQIAYERNTDDNPAAAMWRYRSRITIEHLGFFIEQQKSKTECLILKEFLKQVILLIATIIDTIVPNRRLS